MKTYNFRNASVTKVDAKTFIVRGNGAEITVYTWAEADSLARSMRPDGTGFSNREVELLKVRGNKLAFYKKIVDESGLTAALDMLDEEVAQAAKAFFEATDEAAKAHWNRVYSVLTGLQTSLCR